MGKTAFAVGKSDLNYFLFTNEFNFLVKLYYRFFSFQIIAKIKPAKHGDY
jgi:hypothetical protein